MQRILKTLMLFLLPLYAHTEIEIFNGTPVYIDWQNYGEEYEYQVAIYKLQNESEEIVLVSDWQVENSIEVDIQEESSYIWKVYIRELGKSCPDDYQCYCIQLGYFDFYFPNQEIPEQNNDETINTPLPEKPLSPTHENDNQNQKDKTDSPSGTPDKEVLGTSTDEYVPKEKFIAKEFNSNENIVKSKQKTDKQAEKTNVTDLENYCKYYFNIKNNEYKLQECRINTPKLNSSNYYMYKNHFVTSSTGSYENSIKIYVENISCKNFNLFNTKTWFRCAQVSMGTNTYSVDFDHIVYFLHNDKITNPSNFIFHKNTFEISKIFSSLPTDLIFKGYFSLRHRGNWLDQEVVYTLPVKFSKIKEPGSGIYEFPFSKVVHVNQWHGCTEYQCPHKGIDFASIREKIYASDDGVVVAKGYDTYSGKCNSGGNYLVIKYNGGHHMAYMHIEKSYVKNKQEVERGDLIALSGNSGAHNCQPLGHHLHFELRTDRKQITHIDPVPFIDINWSLVKTNKSSLFPKRLSGDNPHPSY